MINPRPASSPPSTTLRTLARVTLIAVLLTFFPGTPPLVPAIADSTGSPSASGKDELALLVRNVRRGEGFRSHFVQNLRAPGAAPSRAEGTLIYKAPGIMVLRYTTPPGQWLKLDGNRMSLFVPQNRQILKKTIHKHRIPETPAILLASISEISRWFLVRSVASDPVSSGHKFTIVLLPRRPDPHLAQARLTLLKGQGILTDLVFMEQTGTTLSISLKDFRILPGVSAKDLAVSVPTGTTVVPIGGAF